MDLSVSNIERIWVDVAYREVPARNKFRELPHWTMFELSKAKLGN